MLSSMLSSMLGSLSMFGTGALSERPSLSASGVLAAMWTRARHLVALGASLSQKALLMAAPVTALAVAACTTGTLLASVGIEWLLLQLGLGADLSSARLVMAVGGASLCLSIGPSTALVYYLLGLLSRASVPAVAEVARRLLTKDAGSQAQRRQIAEGAPL